MTEVRDAIAANHETEANRATVATETGIAVIAIAMSIAIATAVATARSSVTVGTLATALSSVTAASTAVTSLREWRVARIRSRPVRAPRVRIKAIALLQRHRIATAAQRRTVME